MAIKKQDGGKAIYFGVDLGSDSLKISYVVFDKDKNEEQIYPLRYPDGRDSIPGYGYYDENTDGWYFGAEMFTGELGKFDTIVEIKKQIRLIDQEVEENGKAVRIYDHSHEFRKYGEDIHRSVRREYKPTFQARRDTPQTVVEKFFTYVYNERLLPMAKMIHEGQGIPFSGKCKCVFTYPAGVSDRYKNEYRRVVEKAGFEVLRLVPEASMAGLYAFRYFAELNSKRALVVDVGETRYTASVINFWSGIEVKKELPVWEMGGLDYDRALGDYVRETAGVGEELSSLRKFFFNQELKNAKELVLSNRRGVAVAYVGEATAEVYITRDQFKEITTEARMKIAQRVAEDVKSTSSEYVVLTGGCMDSYGLREGIQTALRENGMGSVRVISSQEKMHKGRFLVSLGAAICACGKYKTQLISQLSYGLIAMQESIGRNIFSVMLKAGTKLPVEATATFYTVGSASTSSYLKVYASNCHDEKFLRGEKILDDKHPSLRKLLVGDLKYSHPVPETHPLHVTISVDADGVGRVRAYSYEKNSTKKIAEYTSEQFDMER
ncbi:MAG: Hsp70 family protein [Clostridia bacterium]|nr:Hsp70 family protein [Clostridia bacterium]